MKMRALGASVSSCIVFGALNFATPTLAQTSPSHVTPQTVRPQVVESDNKIVLPETRSTAAPEGAENLSVRVGQVIVEGAPQQFAAQIAAITNPLAGQTVRVADLYQAAAQIEALYARSGMVLTRATLPPQTIRDDAAVRIQIVEGFIEAIDASALPISVRKAVEARAAGLIGQRGLTLAQMERRLLLADGVPGVELQSTLIAGEKTGGAVLVLKADWKPVNAMVGADNRLSNAYDHWSFDTQIVINSVLGAGEQIYALASTTSAFDLAEGDPQRRILGAGAIIPIGNDGLTLNPEYIRADTNPTPPVGGLQIRGKVNHVALRFAYPLILTRRESLNITASFDLLDETQSLPDFGVRLSEDRLRYASFGIDWVKAMGGGVVFSAGTTVTQGIDGLGARNQADALASGILLSRMGSEPDFTHLRTNATLRAPVGKALRFSAMLRGQASLSGALPASQQFSLDHSEGLSGFALGSINADSGVTARWEISVPFNGKNSEVEPYAFSAVGLGHISQPTVLEQGDLDGLSAGGGLRAGLSRHIRAYAELARSHTSIFAKDDTRLTARISFQF